MAINFPSSPTLNQISQVGSNYYIWDGSAWVGYSTSFSLSETVTFATSAGISTTAQGLTGTPNLNVGVVTATSFIGNGSGLTNLVGVSAGIVIKDSGSTVGTAGTIDFGDNLTVSAISAGIVTVTGSASGGGSSQFVTTSAGIHTLSNVGIGTTNPTSVLTVSGDVKVTGIITASSFSGNASSATYATSAGIATYATNAGIATYANNAGIATNAQGLTGTPNLNVGIITATSFVGNGITVTGTTFTNQLNVSGIASVGTGITMYGSTGIVSATTFYGNVVGNISGSITDATNLTGGYANASQLNVSGVATISQGRIQADGSSNLRFGNIAAGSGSGRNIAIGDQVLYSLSGGQGRNIGIGELSYYDTTSGQYNIGLGIQAGQKITTGNYNVILGGYDGQTGLDIRTSSNNVVIADGQGNIRQYINSSGNVGIKTTVITEALTVSGIVSATSFYGTLNAGQLTGTLPAINGSALIGVVGSGSGVIIQDDTTPVGTAGTINFGSNINVTFASGIANVYVPSVPYASVAGVATVATNAQGLTGTPSITVTNVTANRFILPDCGNLSHTDNSEKLTFGTTPDFKIYHLNESPFDEENRIEVKTHPLSIGTIEEVSANNFYYTSLIKVIPSTTSAKVELGFGTSFPNKKLTTTGYGVSITGGINAPTGIITASSFSGSGSGLTNLPAGQLTGTLPAIDGSALLNVTAAGTGIAIRDDNASVGSATTVNFGTGLDVTFSSGIATITASGGSLQSRTTVSGVTTSITNLGIGNTNITGFKSYALMKVGLSTTGWLRLYTDSTSRTNDISRSVGEDPAPGSGVIAEVVTTGISTTQIISPFVMGGNLDNSPTTTIYAAITNLSGTTQAITANLTILQLEA